jgi:AGCS family alanine or glycine:cation symporter
LQFDKIISEISSFVWGYPLLFILIGGGVYLLFVSKFLPFKYFFHAIDIVRGKFNDKKSDGEISHFQALTTALSATVGMGNIAGVAVAISIGGPGAIFWMWVSGIIGMSTKFFTSALAVMYRGVDSAGKKQGGPMYFIVNGLGKKWIPMAIFFSFCGMVGALPVFNVNQLTQAINDIILKPNGYEVSLFSNAIIGLILTILTSIVILGGLKRISSVSAKLVPFMVAVYIISILIILIVNYNNVPEYLYLIFYDAFNADYYSGNSALGGVLGALIILGIRRGAFSNEAGIGMAPMAHGAAKTNNPIKEGFVAMLGPFIDTLMVCTMTALAILVTGAWKTQADGVSLTAAAFESSLSGIGNYILLACVFVFSISSLFSYSYYGTKCLSFIAGDNNKKKYNYIYIISIMLGATTSLSMMINLIDTFFALMAVPTMIATLILAPKVLNELKKYEIKR